MHTLAPLTPTLPEPSTPSCEQVVPGITTGEEEEGKVGPGQVDPGKKPEPLQGGADAGDPEAEKGTSAEGDGT